MVRITLVLNEGHVAAIYKHHLKHHSAADTSVGKHPKLELFERQARARLVIFFLLPF